MSTNADPKTLAETYFRAWAAGDAETLRGLLADDVTFRGPMGTADDAAAAVAGLIGMGQILEGIDIEAMVADDTDVITFFQLRTTMASPTPTANWSHVEDGRITRIRVTFDPREILAAG